MSVNIRAVLGKVPRIAGTLSGLRYLVFEGMKGDTGDSAYEEAVKLGFEGTEAEWLASLKGEDGQDGAPGAPGTPGRGGVSPTVTVTEIEGGHRVTITDVDGAHTFDVMDGDSAAAENAVLYTTQSLSDSQKAQARTNVGAGTYSKPSGGIPKSDLASAVQTSLGKADTALQTAPVTSVNGMTGDVVITVDSSLSVDGAAADAKVTGEKISELSKALFTTESAVFEVGSISASTGQNTDDTQRIRTDYIQIDNLKSVTFDSAEIRILVMIYSNSGFLGYFPTTGSYSKETVSVDDILGVSMNATRIRIVAKAPTSRDVSVSDGESLELVRYALVDEVLEKTEAIIAPVAEKTEEISGIVEMELPLTWVLGTINGTTGADSSNASRIRNDGFIPIAELIGISVSNSKRVNIFAYSYLKNYLGSTGWLSANETKTRDELLSQFDGVAYIRIAVMSTTITDGEYISVNVYKPLNQISEWMREVESEADLHYRFDEKCQVIAYSSIGVAPINTAEHFKCCATNGFDGLKCDVRLTSDDKIILCHDEGFTLDANGRITTFNANNCTLIRNMTYVQCVALEHSVPYEGQYCHPCGIDAFMKICKRYGKIPYITIRDEYISIIAPLIVDALNRYTMTRNSIVNSFTHDSLMQIRALNKDVYLSLVFTPFNSTLRANALTYAKQNNNYMLCLFYTADSHTVNSMINDANVMSFIKTCLDSNIRIYGAQTTAEDELEDIISLGFSGTQYKRPIEQTV